MSQRTLQIKYHHLIKIGQFVHYGVNNLNIIKIIKLNKINQNRNLIECKKKLKITLNKVKKIKTKITFKPFRKE